MTIRDENHVPDFLRDFRKAIDRVANKVGDYLAGKIADKIVAQDPAWPPLATSTIKAKGSSKAWIDSGEIFDLVSNTMTSVRKSGHFPSEVLVQVGIFDHEKAFIAYCLEYGTHGGSIMAGGYLHTWNHIPERPLFRTVFNEEKEKLVKLIPKWIDEELGKINKNEYLWQRYSQK